MLHREFMKAVYWTAAFLILTLSSWAQESDYLVVKKRNGIVLKTYYAGSYIAAETYGGFRLNGWIKAIRNDSLLVLQEEIRLIPTEFGSRVDTVTYSTGVYYNQIRRFNFGNTFTGGRKKGFSQISLPKLMMIGGTGFLLLELVNTAYRGESLNANGKLSALGVAAGVGAGGFLWSYRSKKRDRVGGKYEIEYIRAHSAGR